MARCEDWPACGHSEGGVSFCPDSDGRFRCARCQKKLAKNAPSALCAKCHRILERQEDDERYGGGDHDYSMNG